MKFDLCPGARLAWVGPDLVVLTLGDGQYACLPDLSGEVARAPDGLVEVGDPEIAAGLIEVGVLASAPVAPRRTPIPFTPPRRDLSLVTPPCPAPGAATGMARAWLHMVRHYYGRPLRHLVAKAEQARPPGARRDEAGLVRRVAEFGALLPWTPFQGECLFRSFMLLSFLRAESFDATWMFGVRTWPFQAHCWLQDGDVVLDDVLERVNAFTPILAV